MVWFTSTSWRRKPKCSLLHGQGKTGAPAMDAPAGDLRGGFGAALELGVCLEDELTDAVLGRGAGDRTQQGKAAPLSVDGVLTGWEGDVPTGTAAAFPDAEANQLEPFERAAGEMQLGVGELSGRVAFVVRCDLHDEFCRSHCGLLDPAFCGLFAPRETQTRSVEA